MPFCVGGVLYQGDWSNHEHLRPEFFVPTGEHVHAVSVGRQFGIHNSWATASRAVYKFPGATHESFDTWAEAEEWLAEALHILPNGHPSKHQARPADIHLDPVGPMTPPRTPAPSPAPASRPARRGAPTPAPAPAPALAPTPASASRPAQRGVTSARHGSTAQGAPSHGAAPSVTASTSSSTSGRVTAGPSPSMTSMRAPVPIIDISDSDNDDKPEPWWVVLVGIQPGVYHRKWDAAVAATERGKWKIAPTESAANALFVKRFMQGRVEFIDPVL